MSYLLDKKIKRKKLFNVALGVVFLAVLFYFRSGVFDGFSAVSQTIFHPVLVLETSIGGKFKDTISYFISKSSLYTENQNLKSQLNAEELRMANYDSIANENVSLKEILGRKNEKVSMVLATILAKPNRSVYDSLLIDAGTEEGIKIGDIVFALGDIPVGRVDLVYKNSSKVVLFSNSGEKTQAIVGGKDVYMEVVGRGGGNFEIILPRDFILQKGDQVVLPGISPYVLAIAETIISDPRDPFIKFLLRSPVNIQELKFVQVEI
ncbi:MAG: rod shape-determining protein MreC [Candidatus Paceibacterota bacterium]|jgi:cell shape-determining protein MreC